MGGFRIGGLCDGKSSCFVGGCAMNNVNFRICNCFEASVIDWFVFIRFSFLKRAEVFGWEYREFNINELILMLK